MNPLSRVIEEHDAKIKALQEVLIVGENSGLLRPFDNEAFLERMRKKYIS